MERIKLMSDEYRDKLISGLYPPTMDMDSKYIDKTIWLANKVKDECERRATEKLKEAFERGQESILLYPKEQRPTFQQFLKEQEDGK